MDNRKPGKAKAVAAACAASLLAVSLTTMITACTWRQGGGSAPASRQQSLVTDMQLNIMRSALQEKNAILAPTDEQSKAFADESRSSASAVDRDMKSLVKLLSADGAPEARAAADKFAASWKNLSAIDAALLESATQNTNIKAVELSDTVGADLLQKLGENLEKLTARVIPASRKSEMQSIAREAESSVLKIALLQRRHVNAADAAGKASIDASINAEAAKVTRDLQTLDSMTGKKSRPFIRQAATDFEEFMRLNEEIVRLSRLNTNRASAEISLGRKQAALAECERSLNELRAAVGTK